VLEEILSDDFYIVRARGELQSREEMIIGVERGTSDEVRRIDGPVNDVANRVYGDAAVVRALLALHEPPDTLIGRFWNTNAFVVRGGDWRCVAWQVTQANKR
jgi:hypothetical protein